MTLFLPCEVAEIDAVRAAHGETILNLWFEGSPAKARFKRERLVDQQLRCCYCRKFYDLIDNDRWDLEHVLCENHYPQFFAMAENLALSCRRCNREKRDQDVYLPQPRPVPALAVVPLESAQYSIPHPRLDDWDKHVRHVNHQIYVGKSKKGRALLKVCKLNKPAVDDAGLTYDSVVATLRLKFFKDQPNRVKQLSDRQVIRRTAQFATNFDDMRAEAAIAGLQKRLAPLAAKALKRTTDTAVGEAGKLVKKLEDGLANKRAKLPSRSLVTYAPSSPKRLK